MKDQGPIPPVEFPFPQGWAREIATHVINHLTTILIFPPSPPVNDAKEPND
jgi:hypothetical protein